MTAWWGQDAGQRDVHDDDSELARQGFPAEAPGDGGWVPNTYFGPNPLFTGTEQDLFGDHPRDAPAPEQATPDAESRSAGGVADVNLPARPLVIGTAIHSFEARPATWPPFRPDTVLDGWGSDRFAVRCASVRGYSHRWERLPRQDDLAVALHESTGIVLVAVADGLSSAAQSHQGAEVACHTAIKWLHRQLDAGTDPVALPWSDLMKRAALALVEFARQNFPAATDGAAEAERLLATTLVAGMVVPQHDGSSTAWLIRAGDSGAWRLRQGAFTPLLGAKLADSGAVVDSAVEFPLPSLPPIEQVPQRADLLPGDVLLIGTDGFGDPLGSGDGEVGRIFAHHLADPLSPISLAYLLDFSRETYDDDRSLIALWPRSRQ